MDLIDYSRQLMEPYFKEEYKEQKEQIISKLSSNPDSCELAIVSLGLDKYLAVSEKKEEVPPSIEFTDNGVKIYSWNDRVLDELINSIPLTIKKLKINAILFNKRPDMFKRFTELESLEIDGPANLLPSDIELLRSVKGLKEVKCRMTIPDVIRHDKSANVVAGSNVVIQYDNLKILSDSLSMWNYVVYNGPLEDFSSFMKPEYVNLDRFSTPIYRNGNKILEYYSKDRKIKLLLTDPLEESYKFLNQFLESTGVEYGKIELVTNNRSFSDMDTLYKFKNFGDVAINYEATYTATIDQYVNMRANLDYFVTLIKQNNLSPAERVCYAYDLVKSYIYREDEEEKSNARYIHNIVETGNIVCVGYATFLAELLKEVGIDAHAIGTTVPLEDGSKAGHERNIVEIHDDRYGIDGLFALDCTWDSNRVIYKVMRDGEEKYVKKLKEDDEVLYQHDVMSSYNFFLIPAQQYELYFPGEAFHRDIKDWKGVEYNPENAALESIPQNNDRTTKTDEKFEDSSIDEDAVISLIYNTRRYEGYSREEDDRLIEEVKNIRQGKRPKELISEDGMTK